MAEIEKSKGKETADSFQQKVAQLQFLEEQAKAFQRQQAELGEQILDLQKSRESLNQIKKAKVGDEILIPLGAGVWAFGKLQDVENVVSSLGADVAAKKDITAAITLIDEQIENVKKIGGQIEEQLGKMQNVAQRLQSELQNQMKGMRRQ